MKAWRLTCPHCGQSLHAERFGVVLRPIWVQMIDAILRAGPDGITRDDLRDVIYGDERVTRNVVSVHVHAINERLIETDYRIRGGQGHTYRIVRLSREEAA